MIKKQQEKKNKSTFIRKLYEILENQNNSNIIKWVENGTAFMICNKQLFISEILKQHYKHSKISSFLKQLNIYGFKRVFNQTSKITYQHLQFTQGFVNFDLPKITNRIQEQNTIDDIEFINLMKELRFISQNQVTMCQKLEECKQIQSTASQQISALNNSMLQCIQISREAEYLQKFLIKIVNGMESQFCINNQINILENNMQLLFDELFENGNIQELQLSELTTPLSLQFTPTPLLNQHRNNNKNIRYNITRDPDFIWNNNRIE